MHTDSRRLGDGAKHNPIASHHARLGENNLVALLPCKTMQEQPNSTLKQH